ncbi:hypothetical protein PsorP6_002925 [Peronosclerospora sorghi]|uniref:Uncharacterized protein n=1 Tax=Peronosclerospora sorghi TaxID=230839 RepID=A0ACC0VNG9_9STRA|nr:hypothetical protein PsorP6_002925 [Peronosclerospora sorghi]
MLLLFFHIQISTLMVTNLIIDRDYTKFARIGLDRVITRILNRRISCKGLFNSVIQGLTFLPRILLAPRLHLLHLLRISGYQCHGCDDRVRRTHLYTSRSRILLFLDKATLSDTFLTVIQKNR